MNAFWLSLFLIFLAELGDKTQLVALTFATRIKPWVVLAGVFCATLLVHIFSAVLGRSAGALLPASWIKFLAGVAFIGFGLWTLRGDSLEEDESRPSRISSPFWLVAVTFFLAELGDKTMLSTVTLAATNAFLPVWLGSTVGMVLSDGLAILVGSLLGARLPERLVKIVAAAIFVAFGVIGIIQGGLGLPLYAWLLGAAAIGLMCLIFLRPRKGDRSL